MNIATEMNTHAVFKNLVNHGFTEQQAEAITEAVSTAVPSSAIIKEQFNAHDRELSNLKTETDSNKKDISEIKTDIAVIKLKIEQIQATMATKSDLNELRIATQSDLNELRIATQSDLNELRIATQSDLNALRTEVQSEFKNGFAELKIDMLKWMIPLLMTIIIGVFVPLFTK